MDHRLFDLGPGTGEHEVPERDDTGETPIDVDHVHVAHLFQRLVEPAQCLDRLARGDSER